MNRIAIASVMLIGGILMVGQTLPSVSAQQGRVCLHGTDETPAERTRRNEAVGYARSIHNAQARFNPPNKRYGQVTELPGLGVLPAGFALQHAADASSYIFSVKDTTDQCRFTLFSDQNGIIYVAGPMQ